MNSTDPDDPRPKYGKTKASHAAYQRWYMRQRKRNNGGQLTLARGNAKLLSDR